jgi:hypothetical protein
MTDSDLVRAGRTLRTMKTPSRWSLSYTGNRVLLAVVLGLAAFVPTRSVLFGIAIAALAYIAATVIASRMRQAGTERQP